MVSSILHFNFEWDLLSADLLKQTIDDLDSNSSGIDLRFEFRQKACLQSRQILDQMKILRPYPRNVCKFCWWTPWATKQDILEMPTWQVRCSTELVAEHDLKDLLEIETWSALKWFQEANSNANLVYYFEVSLHACFWWTCMRNVVYLHLELKRCM